MLTVDSTHAFKYQWIVWRLFGLHPSTGDSFWARHYTAYSIAFNVIANICIPLSFYVGCVKSRTLTEFCENFYVAAVVIVEQLKLANVLRVRGHLMELHAILRQLDKRLQSDEERRIIQSKVVQSRKIFIWVLRLFLMAMASAACFVAFAPDWQLPFPAWIPWDWQHSRHIYLITICLQNIGVFILAVIALNNDTYPVAYLIMVAGHCKALALRIAKLGHSRRMTQSQTQAQMIECIEDHKTILQLVQTMESSVSFACFIQFLCTATSLCSLSFFAFYVKMSPLKVLHLFFMLLAIIIETLIVCYASEQVTHEGEQMAHAIYACNWFNQSVQFRRNLLLMLMRSQRPIGIVAVKTLPVRMRTLVAVIKGAYTMFTLLNELKKTNCQHL
ncbi:odorant receptor 19a [Drosophila novamexicana]|uniref:odorant receptor 19a n=1 Tax=Drosophila novamexicana TaxID=47314 RepID=UPI0011E5C50A|nr:odorant receptor 19a [Drosophila novamexicana]